MMPWSDKVVGSLHYPSDVTFWAEDQSARTTDDRQSRPLDHILAIVEYADPVITPEFPRWDVVRRGEREPISWFVRRAVSHRDNYCCRRCHRGFDEAYRFELDHIIPWSAGGSDDPTNLRLLCEFCNQQRSNLIDGTEDRPAMRVTWWCIECWTPDNDETRPWTVSGGNTYSFDIGHRVEAARVQAYCAHCKQIAWTDVTLADDARTQLDAAYEAAQEVAK